MLRKVNVLYAVVLMLGVAEAFCPIPDGLNKRPKIHKCPNTAEPQFSIFLIYLVNERSIEYPLNLREEIVFRALLSNNGPTVQNITTDITLHVYGKILWSECQWLEIPTFKNFQNLSKCQNCPIVIGQGRALHMMQDFSHSGIMKLLVPGLAYKLVTTVSDGNDPTKLLACVEMEAVLTK